MCKDKAFSYLTVFSRGQWEKIAVKLDAGEVDITLLSAEFDFICFSRDRRVSCDSESGLFVHLVYKMI